MDIVKHTSNKYKLSKEKLEDDYIQDRDFLDFSDTPSSYPVTQTTVISTSTEFEFKQVTFLDFSDTPSSYTGNSGYVLTSSDIGIVFLSTEDIAFPSSTRMIFVQPTAPIGWTQDTSINDRMLRVVSGNGQGTGGTWDLTTETTGSTTITISQLPAHTHTYITWVYGAGTCRGSSSNSGGGIYISYPSSGGGGGGNQPHSHTISSDDTWRPSYIDVIIAEKN